MLYLNKVKFLFCGEKEAGNYSSVEINVFAVRIGNRLYAHKDKLDEWLLNQIGC